MHKEISSCCGFVVISSDPLLSAAGCNSTSYARGAAQHRDGLGNRCPVLLKRTLSLLSRPLETFYSFCEPLLCQIQITERQSGADGIVCRGFPKASRYQPAASA